MPDKSDTNKAWGGRFKNGLTREAAQFTDSQHFDRKLYKKDILASKAHAAMLGKQGIITEDDARLIIEGLDKVEKEISSGRFVWQPSFEDVHMNIEARLTEIIGSAGKKLHTGRSRNDQVGLTFRLFVADQCHDWINHLIDLIGVLVQRSSENRDVIMPGFTHLQPAQPVVLAHHLLAYAGMLRRDAERIKDALSRVQISPLGAAALAGSTYPLDPYNVAQTVGFPQVYPNSMDAVSDRDFVLEALFIGSVIMMHLSRLCEELILWANPAFGFIEIPDEFSTGSSIMPQKKNPDIAELMRGKTGRTYGNLIALLTTMKGLPLAYNRDMQEDKEPFFDTTEVISASLGLMADMLSGIKFNRQHMRAACKAGFLNATDLADYLVEKGIPFRDAHHITGRAVARAEELGLGLEDLPLEEFKNINPLIDNDIFDTLSYASCIARRETPGGTGPKSIQKQLQEWDEWLLRIKDGEN